MSGQFGQGSARFHVGPGVEAGAFGEFGGLEGPPGRAGRNRAGGPGRVETGQARERCGVLGVGRERGRSRGVVDDVRRLGAEQLGKNRCYLLTGRDGFVDASGVGSLFGLFGLFDFFEVDDNTAQPAIGTVEGHVQTWHRNQRGFARHAGGKAVKDHLASLGLKTRREVVHNYNSTPSGPPWPAFSAGT